MMTNREWLEKLPSGQLRRVARQWAVPGAGMKPIKELIDTLEVEPLDIQDTPVRADQEFTARILEYWDVNLQSTMKNPTYIASADNATCGDQVGMQASIIDGVIKELHFIARGCCISDSSAAILVEHFRGKTVKEALDFTRDQMLELVGAKISPARHSCVTVSLTCLQALCSHETP